jgi:phosphoglycolate phosphatase
MKVGILWDLDGTLLDTMEDLADAVNYALARCGYPMRSGEEIRSFVGGGAKCLLEQSVPEGADARPAQNFFWEYYSVHCQDKTKPYPGILKVLDALKHYPMAVVSNKPDDAVKPLCAKHFPGIYALGERPDCPRKPAPDMVRRAMADIGVESCIYVGDSEVDVLTAKNADVPCLSVLWGFRNRDEIEAAGGNCFCNDPAALPEMLEAMIRDLTAE